MIGKDQIVDRTYHYRCSSAPATTQSSCYHLTQACNQGKRVCCHGNTQCCKSLQRCGHGFGPEHSVMTECRDYNGHLISDLNPQPPPRGTSSVQSVQALSNKLKSGNYVMTPELRRKFQRKQSRDKLPTEKQTDKMTSSSPAKDSDSPNSSIRSEGDGNSTQMTHETTPPHISEATLGTLDTMHFSTPPPVLQRTKYSLADLNITPRTVRGLQKHSRKYKSLNNVTDHQPECEIAYLKEELISRLIKEKERLLELKRAKQEQRERVLKSRLQDSERQLDRTVIIESTPDPPSTPPYHGNDDKTCNSVHTNYDITTPTKSRQPVCTVFDTPTSRDQISVSCDNYSDFDSAQSDKLRDPLDNITFNDLNRNGYRTSETPKARDSLGTCPPSYTTPLSHVTKSRAIISSPRSRNNLVSLKSDAATEILKSKSRDCSIDQLDNNKSVVAKSWRFNRTSDKVSSDKPRETTLDNNFHPSVKITNHSDQNSSSIKFTPIEFPDSETPVHSPTSSRRMNLYQPKSPTSTRKIYNTQAQSPTTPHKSNPHSSTVVPVQRSNLFTAKSPIMPRKTNSKNSQSPISSNSNHGQSNSRNCRNIQSPKISQNTTPPWHQSPSRKDIPAEKPSPHHKMNQFASRKSTSHQNLTSSSKTADNYSRQLSSQSCSTNTFSSPDHSSKKLQSSSRDNLSSVSYIKRDSITIIPNEHSSNSSSNHSRDATPISRKTQSCTSSRDSDPLYPLFDVATYQERAVDCPKDYISSPVTNRKQYHETGRDSNNKSIPVSSYKRAAKKKSQKDKCHTQ